MKEYYTIEDIINLDMINTMKNNIKSLGQQRTLNIINGGHLILTDKQRKIYKNIFFHAVHQLESEA